MFKSFLGAMAVAGIAVAPAIAQTQNQSTDQQQPSARQPQAPTQGTQAQGTQAQGTQAKGTQAQQSAQTPEQQMQSRIASQAQVREVLNTSGFENVAFVDAAYLVTALAPSGETVMMVVNPSGMMSGMLGSEPTATSSTTPQGASGSGSAQEGRSESGQTNR